MKSIQRAESGAFWIKERGPRYGNNRKMRAKEKVAERRRSRARMKVRFLPADTPEDLE